ncbi:MAG: hypothetical protein ACR2QO_13370 [Acidimicrobiales bacterium]
MSTTPDGRPDDPTGDVAPGVADPPVAAVRVRSIEAAAAAGILYAVLAVLALTRMSSYPSLSSSEAELTSWFDDDGNQILLGGALTLASVSAIAFLWFVAVIRRRLGDREDRFFATVFFGSGIAYVAVWLVGAAVLAGPAIAMTTLDAAEVTAASASLAGGVAAALLLVVGPRVQAVFIFTTSTVILRSKVLPTWLAYIGYLAGVIMFLAPFVYVQLAYAFPVWVFVVSVVLLIVRPSSLDTTTPGDGAVSGANAQR